MKKINDKTDNLRFVAEVAIHMGKMFLIGYGLASIIIDIKDGKKEA